MFIIAWMDLCGGVPHLGPTITKSLTTPLLLQQEVTQRNYSSITLIHLRDLIFIGRVISQSIVDSPSVNDFKTLLDRHYCNSNFLFDFV